MWRTWKRWILLLVVPVIAACVGLLFAPKVDEQLDEAFVVDSFMGDYALIPDGRGNADLRITETIETTFVQPDRRGILRDVPEGYRGLDQYVRQVEARGGPTADLGDDPEAWPSIPVSVERSDGIARLRIGDRSSTVPVGPYTFRVSYTLTEVALGSGADQEVYLNANGNGWGVPFGSVEARLHVPADLAGRLDGDTACYQGPLGSTERCAVETHPTDDGAVTVVARSGRSLAAFEGLTFAVGFTSGTFPAARTPALLPTGSALLLAVPVVFSLLFVGYALYRRAKVRRRPRVEGQPAVRYAPPEGMHPIVAADIWGAPERGPAAELVAAVLDGEAALTLEGAVEDQYAPAGPPRPLSGRALRSLRSGLRITGLDQIKHRRRRQLLRDYFKDGRFDGPSGVDARTLTRRLALIEDGGWREAGNPRGARWFLAAYVALSIVVLAVGIALALADDTPWWARIVSAVIAFLLLVWAAHLQPMEGPLSAEGREAYEELRGLERFIAMAEKDRIAWLQSTTSAPRVRDGDGSRLKLYEPLLPYAVIFGHEDSWSDLIDAELPSGTHALGLAIAPLGQLVGSMTVRSAEGSARQTGSGLATLSTMKTFFSSGGSSGGYSSGSSGGSSGGGYDGGSSGGGSSGGGMGGGGGSSW